MRLSELLEPGETKVMGLFLKFLPKKEYLHSLQQGYLRMNNLRSYIQVEKETGQKGLGDAWEATQVLNEVDFQVTHRETNQVVAHGHARRISMRPDGVESKPVFCMLYIGADMVEVVEDHDDHYDCRVVFSDEQLRRFPVEFGEYFMLINAQELLQKVNSAFKKSGYQYVAKPVQYSDYGLNRSDRIQSFVDGDEGVFFWKDSSLSYQKEFRIVIVNRDVDEPLVVDIGPLDGSWVFPTSMLTDTEMRIKVRKPFPRPDAM